MGIEKARNVTISLNGLTFQGANLPKELPLPRPTSRSKEHFMSPGADGPGVRVIQPLGSHISYSNIRFTVGLLTSSQISTLHNYFLDQRSVKTLTITTPDSSTDVYKVLFADDGFEPRIYLGADYDEDKYLAILEFRILEKTS